MTQSGAELTEKIKNGLSFEDLLKEMEGFIYSQSTYWVIPGFDREDVRQEISLKLWDALQKFDLDTGNSFMTIAIPYVRNQMMKLTRDQIRKSVPISGIECNECGTVKVTYSAKGGECEKCGNRRWTRVPNFGGLASLEGMIVDAEDDATSGIADMVGDPYMDTEASALALVEMDARTYGTMKV